jgi:hypothetical protein
VTADPVSDDAILLHHGQSPIFEADASRIDVVLAFQFLEVQSRVRRIALEEAVGTLAFPWASKGKSENKRQNCRVV